MSRRDTSTTLARLIAIALPALLMPALALPAAAHAVSGRDTAGIPRRGAATGRSLGTPEQIAWVRRAAGNFVAAELSGSGSGACSILNAPLRQAEHHRSCEQRWNAKLARLLHERGARSRLRVERRAIAFAPVRVHGDHASIALPKPLLGGSNSFVWSENCWMLQS